MVVHKAGISYCNFSWEAHVWRFRITDWKSSVREVILHCNGSWTWCWSNQKACGEDCAQSAFQHHRLGQEERGSWWEDVLGWPGALFEVEGEGASIAPQAGNSESAVTAASRDILSPSEDEMWWGWWFRWIRPGLKRWVVAGVSACWLTCTSSPGLESRCGFSLQASPTCII